MPNVIYIILVIITYILEYYKLLWAIINYYTLGYTLNYCRLLYLKVS
jgi:hypothetical protein